MIPTTPKSIFDNIDPMSDIEAILDSIPNELLASLENEIIDIDSRKNDLLSAPLKINACNVDPEADGRDDTNVGLLRELFQKGQHEVLLIYQI